METLHKAMAELADELAAIDVRRAQVSAALQALRTLAPAGPRAPIVAPQAPGVPVATVPTKPRILDVLRKSGTGLLARDVARRMPGVPLGTVRSALKKLRDAGQVTLSGHTSSATWTIAPGAVAKDAAAKTPQLETVWNGAKDRQGTAPTICSVGRPA